MQQSNITKATLYFIITLTLIRVFLLLVNGLPLYADEAQYWIWSKNLDLGYYSKPPIIAYVIALSTYFFGDGEAAVRLLSPIIHMLTSFAIWRFGSKFLSPKVGAYSAIIFITLPSIFLSSLIISTDVPLLLIWALIIYFLYEAIRSNKNLDWVAVGLLGGLGMLTKYHFGIIMLSTLIYALWTSRSKYILTNPKIYMASAIALIIFSPNLYWNLQNHFVSFQHTADLANSNNVSLRSCITTFIKFIMDQFVIFGIILLPFVIVNINKIKKINVIHYSDIDVIKFLYINMLTFVGVIGIFAILNKAHANWTAPAYVSGSIIAAYFFENLNRIKLFKYNTIAHISIGIIIIIAPLFANQFSGFKVNPFARLFTYIPIISQIEHLKATYPNAIFGTDDRKTYATLVYYSRPHLWNLKKINDGDRLYDHFDLTAQLNKFEPEILIISRNWNFERINKYFEDTNHQTLTEITLPKSTQYKIFHIK